MGSSVAASWLATEARMFDALVRPGICNSSAASVQRTGVCSHPAANRQLRRHALLRCAAGQCRDESIAGVAGKAAAAKRAASLRCRRHVLVSSAWPLR
ncbi:hypothetical protein ASF90_15720 [Xanthomonas sp. Leaf148]|nr:hypothetical protein ASF90_15720 [Xanthomonas sp. Leaf148]